MRTASTLLTSALLLAAACGEEAGIEPDSVAQQQNLDGILVPPPLSPCPAVVPCDPESERWLGAPACRCVPLGGEPCGTRTCGPTQYCCNPLCGQCAPIGYFCTLGCLTGTEPL